MDFQLARRASQMKRPDVNVTLYEEGSKRLCMSLGTRATCTYIYIYIYTNVNPCITCTQQSLSDEKRALAYKNGPLGTNSEDLTMHMLKECVFQCLFIVFKALWAPGCSRCCTVSNGHQATKNTRRLRTR